MAKPVQWAYDQAAKRWTGDDGDWVLYKVEEGDHAGEWALEDSRRVVTHHSSHDEAREFVTRIQKYRS